MMADKNQILTIAYINVHGQSKLTDAKQVQIEDFLKYNNIDVAHLQETDICDESFSKCNYISSSFNIISNNSENKYGTSSLIKSELSYENFRCDTAGRAIVFELGGITLGNFYAHSGTDSKSRASREGFCSEVVPQLLTNSRGAGCIGGDWNCILEKSDATAHPESKLSNTLKRVVKAFGLLDSYKTIHPKVQAYSRYYGDERGHGASRIDRQYHWGNLKITDAKYLPLSFSDHHGLVVSVLLPDPLSRILCPKGRPSFRMKEEVIKNQLFQKSLAEAMLGWNQIKDFGMDTLQWWEVVVKPGIRKLAMLRGKQMNKDSKEELNLLLVRQAYINKKVKLGDLSKFGEVQTIHHQIQAWYKKTCDKVKDQSRATEFQRSEKVTIYHHEIHQKIIKKSAILKLDTPVGLLEGHDKCSEYLESQVKDLLLNDAQLDPIAQEKLLEEVMPCFTEADNAMFRTPPSKKDVKETVDASNVHAAPGNDGIPSLFYKVCWDIIGDPLTEVMLEIFRGKPLPPSLRSSLMVFGSKPKKPNSIKPQDKRRISLLNSDFKVASGLEARKLKKTLTHSLSPLQLVAGEDRRIHHGINLARDAIWAAGKRGQGCGILDTDLIAGFDYMCLSWCLLVLRKKGACPELIARLENLYSNNYSLVVINNIIGAAVKNIRLTLRQGDVPSMEIFSFGIDPLLILLERVLNGILIASVPVLGPRQLHEPPLAPKELRYKVIGYADDAKPAITSMEEFKTVNKALSLFEKASGCRVHRDPANMKCKFLPLGRWRTTLQQEDIPCNYMTLSDHLDMVGVTLMASWSKTRKSNGDALQLRVENTIRPWKGGKFMPVTQRGWTINSYAQSKVWFRTRCVDLRVCDIKKITSSCKSWLYQDMFAKPEEMILHRPHHYGGLGMHSIKYKALAGFINTFLQTAANPLFRQNLLHNLLFRKNVLCEDVPGAPATNPPYFTDEMFSIIKRVKETSPMNIIHMKEKDWTRLLTEDYITMVSDVEDGPRYFSPCRAELNAMTTDWELSWANCRRSGVSPELASFLWLMLYDLLSTQARLHRMGSVISPKCKMQGCPDDGTLQHELLHCSKNDGIGHLLVNSLQQSMPSLDPASILRLEFADQDEAKALAMTWLTAITLSYIWKERQSGSSIRSYRVRAEIEQYINLLRTTRFKTALEILINFKIIMFQ